MSGLFLRIRQAARLAAATVAALGLGLAGTGPVHADTPEGNGITIENVTEVDPDTLEFTGTYSCSGSTTVQVAVEAKDTALGVGAFLEGFPCPAAGEPFSGQLVNQTPGQTWDSSVAAVGVLAELRNPTGGALLSTHNGFLIDDIFEVIMVDSAELTSTGAVTVSGRIRCSTSGDNRTLTVNVTQTDANGGTTTGEVIKTAQCPATPGTLGTWTDDVAPLAFEYQPGTASVLTTMEADAILVPDFPADKETKLNVMLNDFA
ncbi:hypothetical protein [Streptomyces sp. PR69]|uniref:hypothetical protein n=1 Tax=Streptomyces sp. PR69 TaxID=2984950 RepID=UPI00226448AA|nr:hypothetical protein [Streptomyces sp. PR69]